MLFDVLSLMEEPLHPEPDGALPHWCTSRHCREMDTDLEKVCCRQWPLNCISNMAYMGFYVLDEGVLLLASTAWNDVFALEDSQEPGVEQRQFRHAAYSLSCGSMAASEWAEGWSYPAAVSGK